MNISRSDIVGISEIAAYKVVVLRVELVLTVITDAALRVVVAVGNHKRNVSLCNRLNESIYGALNYCRIFFEFF